MSPHQRDGAERILANTDRVQVLRGAAGTGKTTVLAAINDAARREGYEVRGVAPTSRAAQLLEEAGADVSTLQKYLQDA